MTDTDATRKRHRVADPLREYAQMVRKYHGTDIHGKEREYVTVTTREMLDIADQIDREHERRMDQAREDSRKHTCNYLSRIIADYKRGKKWKRKDYPNG